MRLTLCAATLVIAVAGVPAAASSQTPEERAGWWFVPTVRLQGVYQDIVELTDHSRDVGTFLRITSSLETSYRNPRRIFQALYALDSERYTPRLRVLNDAFAQQSAGARLESRGGGFLADGRYVTTTRPDEILEPTGLVAAYRRTTAASASATAGRAFAPRWRGSMSYSFLLSDYGEPTISRPSARSVQHGVLGSLAFQQSPRTLITFDQSARMLVGDDLSTRSRVRGTFWDGYVALRVTRNLTPRVRTTLLAGPRLTQELPRVINPLGFTPLEWKIVPEMLASISYRDVGRTVTLSYARSAFLGFGAAGFIETNYLDVRAAYSFRRVRISGRPAVYRNSLSGLDARSYRLDVGSAVDLTRWLALETTYQYKYQDRAISLVDFGARSPARPKQKSVFIVGMTIARPIPLK